MFNTKVMLACFGLLLGTEQEVHGAGVLTVALNQWARLSLDCRTWHELRADGHCWVTVFCACCQSMVGPANNSDSPHTYYKIDFVIKLSRKNREAATCIQYWDSLFHFPQWLWIKIHLMVILLKSWIRTSEKEVADSVFSLFSQRNLFLILCPLFCPSLLMGINRTESVLHLRPS